MLYKAFKSFMYSNKMSNINLISNELKIYFKQHDNNIIIKDDKFFTLDVNNYCLPVLSERSFINNIFHDGFNGIDLLFVPKSFRMKYNAYIKYLRLSGKHILFYKDDASCNMWLIYLHNIVSKL